MKTHIEQTRKDLQLRTAEQPPVACTARRISGTWRWLALALTAGLGLTAHAQRTATATARVSNGLVVGYTVTDGGSGYTEPPVVTPVDGGGTGATAVALVENGVVTRINPVSPGSGYTNQPKICISAPVVVPPVFSLQIGPLLTIYGLRGDTNQIEAATSLEAKTAWVPLATVVLSNSVQRWYDTISPPGAWRFYRAVLLGAGPRPTPGPRFVWLPAGQFIMGSPANEVGRWDDEGPQTRVTFRRGFFMGRYEVTQGEYLSVIGSNPSSFTGDTNRPVERVSWNDATNYCARLTARKRAAGWLTAGWAYRLPTEAEWEYASRAGSTNRFSYGDDPGYTHLVNYAWIHANSGGTTHPGGGKLPNRWGLYDMSGNVEEWVWDYYSDYYPGGSVTDPVGPVSGLYRAARGGVWSNYPASFCRSAFRDRGDPLLRYYDVGFRVVLAPVQP